jgi:hypothetical protein
MSETFANYELRITNYELRITNYELRITNYELRRGVLAKSLIARSRRSDFGDLQLERTPTQEQATHSVSSRSDNHY